jgi:hypothetical protein
MASLGKGERPPLCLNHEFRKEDSIDARGLGVARQEHGTAVS